ncbi:hypothetical protein O9H85_19205 [Paenibacillus filicis]|uniref:Uncharacterized protein n=1 Tax=Paenibacillus gyeongsangnamensis TaxID=3388067 RepID=A0ABT4QCU9_9BACL|nr:hypothetical protein [Paenibacillus filicis]MCZ8514510.1 hypothetical protein [Paenibacillus filicis]
MLAVVFLFIGIAMLAGQIGGVDHSLQQQTGVLREQNGILASIRDHLVQLIFGVNRIADAVRSAVADLMAQM